MRRTISVVLIICVFLVIFWSFVDKSDEELIENRMNSFLKAYNSGDLEAVLDCMCAKTRNTYKSAMSISNTLIGLSGVGIGIEDMFGLGVGLISDGDLLEFEDMRISIQSDVKATVSVTMHYNEPDASYSQNVKFTLVKEDGDWFIAD